MAQGIEEWEASHAPELAGLAGAALPDEALSTDELLSCCWEDPPAATPGAGAVLGLADGTGAVAVVWRPPPPGPRVQAAGGSALPAGAFVKLIVVHPAARRQGRAHALLAAAESWAWEHGARELRLAGSPPFYLWPGVDATAIEALCLAEARGYEIVGTGLNLALPTAFRAPTPEGAHLRRVIDDADVAALDALVSVEWPHWWDEARRAVEHGCCHGAFVAAATGAPAIGFVCHSVSRAGWLGPMGTDPARRGDGIGQALLSAACRDLMIADLPRVEICWAGPLRFYAKSGATVSRAFFQFSKARP